MRAELFNTPATVRELPEGKPNTRDSAAGERSAWQREMERAQMQGWLAHGVIGHSSCAIPQGPASPASAISGESARIPARQLQTQAKVANEHRSERGATDLANSGAQNKEEPLLAEALPLRRLVGHRPDGSFNRDVFIAELTIQLGQSVAAMGVQLPVGAVTLATTPAGAAPVDMQPLVAPTSRSPFAPAVAYGPTLARSMPETDPEPFQAALNGASAPERLEEKSQQPMRLHAQWTDQGLQLWLGLDAGYWVDTSLLAAQLQRQLAVHGQRLLSFVCNGRSIEDIDTATEQRVAPFPLSKSQPETFVWPLTQ